MTISREDLAHAIDNCTPYPIEINSEVCLMMADQLLSMLHIEKNEDHLVWHPESDESRLVNIEPIDPEKGAPSRD